MTGSSPRTPTAADDTLSLRQQLVNWLFTPLFLLLLFSTVTGYMAAVTLANKPYDLVLLERARLLASRYAFAPAEDLAASLKKLAGPPQEFLGPHGGQLGSSSRAGGNAYRPLPAQAGDFRFSLHDLSGNGIVAIGRLPKPRPLDYQIREPQWRDTQFQGRKLRLVTFRFEPADGPALLAQAAEPIDARQSLGRSILGNIVIPQFMFIVIAGVAVWIGLKRGFEPLERLRREVAARPRDDPQPLDASQAPDEVRPLILEVNALIERMKAMMAAQRRFVADAAHQLRTPFAGLKARAELAKREAQAEPVRDALAGICDSAQRCSHLVNQLLTLARNEPDARLSSPMHRLDLHRVAQESAAHWAPEALRNGVDLGFEGPGRPLPVRGHEPSLRDLLDNLLDNAIRYTPADGHITVRVGDGDQPWLAVEDDGPGIPADQRAQVFERFHRMPGSNQPGSGLGLAIVREVARRHGATVCLEEGRDGRGCRFTVRFPQPGAVRTGAED